MTTYAAEAEKHATTRKCKISKHGGCGMTKPMTDFPGSWRTYETGIREYVRGYWCRDCYNRRNRENAHRIEARRKASTQEEDDARIAKLYFCDLPAPAMSVALREERLRAKF